MADVDPLEERKKLSFEQAEGLVPLPSQLERGKISQEFRAILWARLHKLLEERRESFSSTSYLMDPWTTILRNAHVYRDHRPIDEFSDRYYDALDHVKKIVLNGNWSDVLGWLEFVFKHPACPDDFAQTVDAIMAYCRLGYRVFDGTVIAPVGSEAERTTIEKAFADVATAEFHGARSHLRKAAEQLTGGNYPDSIRESIHAVESVVKVLEPSGDFSKALAKLEAKVEMHGALKKGFVSIYGYTSDEKGVRHALIDDPASKVDETDALFMIGACAAFVSYNRVWQDC